MPAKKNTTTRGSTAAASENAAATGYVARAEFHGVDELGDKLTIKPGDELPDGFLDSKLLKKNLARGTIVKVGSDQDDVSGEGQSEE